MPFDYVEDYEQVTGKKIPKSDVHTKVVTAPAEPEAGTTEAEVK